MFETSFAITDLQFMLAGAWVTLKLTMWAMLIGTASGLLFGLLRAVLPLMTAPLSWLLDVFRSVPLLIQFVLLATARTLLACLQTSLALHALWG